MLAQNRIKFNKTTLEALPPAPKGKRTSYQDTEVKNLYLRVTATGVKSFCVFKRIAGKLECITIGKFPEVTVTQARTKATDILASLFKGDNPAEVKRQLKGEPTFGDLFKDYMKHRKLADSTRVSYETTVAKHLAGILPLKISQVSRDRLRALKLESDAQSNRIRAIISAVFTWANTEGIIDQDNPSRVIKNRHIASRERFLQPDEVERFIAALAGNNLGSFYLMCLVTGQRQGSVRAMRWADINWKNAIWMLPMTKNKEPHAVPLMPEAIEILESRKGIDPVWVFPSTGKTGHLVEPKKSWDRLRRDAGLPDLNMHDLRRTMGSWQSMDGASLTTVGKTLGQKSPEAMKVYARMNLTPVREAMDKAMANLRGRRTLS